MIQIDLITGFLGSGKTTFIKKYAEWLVSKGYQVGIIENDFGAVNIDMLMLQDLLGDRIDVEQIVGGSVVTDWKRRFRTKLISMAMRGFNRILVEPSGIYDVDAFFDVLHDEPIDSWYEAGNVITILDAGMDECMSRQEEYLMVSQTANAGMLILSKVQDASPDRIATTLSHLNHALEEFKCPRRFEINDTPASPLCKPWDSLTDEDFALISSCGWVRADHEKLWFDPKKAFSSLFFMHVKLSQEALAETLQQLFQDDGLGIIFRIKGYLPLPEGDWLQINATPSKILYSRVPMGQEILIVIGQDLQESLLRPYFFPRDLSS